MARGDLQLGEMVLVQVNPRQNNGEDRAPGLVVRVLDVEDERRANLRVFLDGEEVLLLRNVQVLDKEPDEDDEDAPTQFAVRA